MNKIFTLLLLSFSFGLLAQQTPQSSLFSFNVYDFNPAIAGIDGELSINGDIRSQWVGIVGAPLTQSINAHLPVYITKGGFGVSLKNFTYGVSQNIEATISYNQLLDINEKLKLSFGLGGGIVQHSFRGSELLTPDRDFDPPLNHNDLDLPETDVNGVAPVLIASVLIEFENLRIGLSGDNLLESQFGLNNSPKDVVFNQIRHYYGYGSYDIELDNDLILSPSVLLRAESAEIQADFNVSAEFRERFMLGASYRGYSNLSSDAIVFQGGFRLNSKLIMRYAYDFGLSELRNVHNGSHEILISYNIATNFGKGTPPQIIYNPRFL